MNSTLSGYSHDTLDSLAYTGTDIDLLIAAGVFLLVAGCILWAALWSHGQR